MEIEIFQMQCEECESFSEMEGNFEQLLRTRKPCSEEHCTGRLVFSLI